MNVGDALFKGYADKAAAAAFEASIAALTRLRDHCARNITAPDETGKLLREYQVATMQNCIDTVRDLKRRHTAESKT